MRPRDFKLEVYFGKYEFTAPYLLTQSDCEAMEIRELLAYEPGSEELLMKSWLGYTEVYGNPELRRLVASLYTSMKDENILMHAGAQEAIFDYMNVVLEKGDHVVSLFPIYQSLFEVALSNGCEVSKWELEQTQAGWALNFDTLEKLIRPNTKLIVVNTPNNPTGYTLDEDEIKKLCEIADKHGIRIFADEVYHGLDPDGVKKPWVADVYERAISLGVMSKSYGLAGLRIGWVATKDVGLLEKMAKFKHYMSICNSAPSEILSIIALKHSDELLRRSTDIVRGNLKIADDFFGRHANLFQNNKPQAGSIAFHKMHTDMSIDQFCDELVTKTGVLLLPGSVYEYEGPFFRMGYGRKNFEESLKRFEAYIISQNLNS